MNNEEQAIIVNHLARGRMSLNQLNNPTKEMIDAAVSFDGDELQFVENQTEEMCIVAINRSPYSFRFVKDQTPTLIELAITRRPVNIQFVHDQRAEYVNLAIEYDGISIIFVRNPTIEQMVMACLRDHSTLSFLNYSSELLHGILDADINFISKFRRPFSDVEKVELMLKYDNIQFSDFHSMEYWLALGDVKIRHD